MDQAVNVEENVASSSVGEKRLAEYGALPAAKRPRCGDMTRVAEIVLVLSAMGRIRGGVKSPTEAEVRLMSEAREMLAEMCAEVAPKDIVGRDAIGAVIEDLGLNGKSKEQRLGFRASRLTIAEKLSLAQKKMEDPKKLHTPSPTYTSQPLQTSLGGSAHTLRGLPSERPSHAAMSSGSFSVSSAPAHVTAATSNPLPHQLPTYTVSTTLPSGQLGKDSSSFSVPRGDRSQVKVEGGSNLPFVSPAWSMQPQSAAMTRSGQESKVLNPGITRTEGTADLNMSLVASQAARDQSSRPFVSQTASGTFQSVSHQSIQAPPYINNHNEIAKIVQKLLQPKLPENPTWTPPSREYMNKPMTCQLCKVTINEVETVLLCDACEKGYHLKCLQPTSQKSIPRGEWHCVRCLSLSNGKPLPPKYGRVMRSIAPQKGLPNPTLGQSITAEAESSSEKKNGSMDQKVSLPFSITVAQSTASEAEQFPVKKLENPDQNVSQHPNGTPAVFQPSPAGQNQSTDRTSIQSSISEAHSYLEKKVENLDQKISQPSGTGAVLSTTSVKKVENSDQDVSQPTGIIPVHSSIAEAEPLSVQEVESPLQIGQQDVTENENSGIQVSSAFCSVTSNPGSAPDSEDPLALSENKSEVFTGGFPNKPEKPLGAGDSSPSVVLSSEKEVENTDERVTQQLVTENQSSNLQVLSVFSTGPGHPGSALDSNVLFSPSKGASEFPERSEMLLGSVVPSEKETENPDSKVSQQGMTENQSSGSQLPFFPPVFGVVSSNPVLGSDSEDLLSFTEKEPGLSTVLCGNESENPLDAGCGSQSVVSSSERVPEHAQKVEPSISGERETPNAEVNPSITLFNRSNDNSVFPKSSESFQNTPMGRQKCDEVAPRNCPSADEELQKPHSSDHHDCTGKQNELEVGAEIPAGSLKPDIVATEVRNSSESLLSAEDVAAK